MSTDELLSNIYIYILLVYSLFSNRVGLGLFSDILRIILSKHLTELIDQNDQA